MTILVSPLLQRLAWLEHGFGTRHAGLSQEGMTSLKQIHSSLVFVADRPSGCVGEGDGLITNAPGVSVSIRTADCYPILLADPAQHAVAAVHAGWRGTAGGIIPAAIAAMRSQFGTAPGDMYAAIGPGVGPCCYQVGIEVARQFGLDRAGPIDLAAENRRQLVEAGVSQSQIDIVGRCTSCDPENFHSYRRDHRHAGRMISYIRIHQGRGTGKNSAARAPVETI